MIQVKSNTFLLKVPFNPDDFTNLVDSATSPTAVLAQTTVILQSSEQEQELRG